MSDAPRKSTDKSASAEQKNGAAASTANDAGEASKPDLPPVQQTIEQEIFNNLALIGRSVLNVEPRFTNRVLRQLTATRRRLSKNALRAVLNEAFPTGSKTGQSLIASSIFDSLPETAPSAAPAAAGSDGMDVDSHATGSTSEDKPAAGETKKGAAGITTTTTPSAKKNVGPVDPVSHDLLPEGIAYLRLLLVLAALDAGKTELAGEFALETVEMMTKANRRSMDQIAAKVYFYLALAYERQDRLAELQPRLLAARQTARLRKDENLEATLLNLLLRSYLAQNQYEQADKLIARTTFPTSANQAQTVRWLFYAGRLLAVQLNYSKARDFFTTAIRRAPKDEVAPGFVQLIYKYYIVVFLLTGVIPERAIFRKPVLKEALIPYFQIVQAVRVGDMQAFQTALKTHAAVFHADSTYYLIIRLRHFVIKTALRTITLAYSRISLRDVCFKLHLDSAEDAEFIVAKAIKDGVIDATIDHAQGFMQSKTARDVYETDEPQKEFTARTEYCTEVYNESIRAMRYPADAHRKELDDSAESRERDREIVQMIQDGGDDDDDMDDGDMF